MNQINSLSQLDRRDEIILAIVASFIPMLGFAAMLY